MKILKSKRFWLNLTTALTMLGSLTNVVELNATESKYVTICVVLGNIILQAFFNQDKKNG